MKEIKAPTRPPKQIIRESIVTTVSALVCGGFTGLFVFFLLTDPGEQATFMVVLTVGFGLFTLWFGSGTVSMLKGLRSARLLDEMGITTQGTVTKLSKLYMNEDHRWYVGYTFTDEMGQAYSSEKRILLQEYARLNKGGPITVRYLPTNPTIHRPEL